MYKTSTVFDGICKNSKEFLKFVPNVALLVKIHSKKDEVLLVGRIWCKNVR